MADCRLRRSVDRSRIGGTRVARNRRPNRSTPHICSGRRLARRGGSSLPIERQLQRRSSSNPNVKYDLTIPLRDPQLWRDGPKRLLEELLGFLGNTVWELNVVNRRGQGTGLSKIKPSSQLVRRVALFSGGLDSACGAGAGLASARDNSALLVLFPTKNPSSRYSDEAGFSKSHSMASAGYCWSGKIVLLSIILISGSGCSHGRNMGGARGVQFEKRHTCERDSSRAVSCDDETRAS